jgi:hypothetical protein
LIIKPSKAAVFPEPASLEMRHLRGGSGAMVISCLNPILRGWTALLPDGGLQTHLRLHLQPPVVADLETGRAEPPEQAEEMGRRPQLRHVQTSPGPGNAGSSWSRRRSADKRSPPTSNQYARTDLTLHAWSTPSAPVRPHGAPNGQPAIPSGLLEPDAGTTRTSGSEGAPMW